MASHTPYPLSPKRQRGTGAGSRGSVGSVGSVTCHLSTVNCQLSTIGLLFDFLIFEKHVVAWQA